MKIHQLERIEIMGYYIEPEDQSINGKMNWLDKYAISISREDVAKFNWSDPDGKTCLLCAIINNPQVIAIAFVYSKQELDIFRDPKDKRLKMWYLCEYDIIKKYCPTLLK